MTKFDLYLRRIQGKEIILFDRVSGKQYALSKTDILVRKYTRKTILNGISMKGTRSMIAEPQFSNSEEEAGLQIADTISYCTSRFLKNKKDFCRHWDLIYSKIQTGKDGDVNNYGLAMLP